MHPFEIVGIVLGAMLMIYNLFLTALRRNPLKQCKDTMTELMRLSDAHAVCEASHGDRITKLEVVYEQMVKIMDSFNSDLKDIKKDVKDLLLMGGNKRR